MALRFHFPFSSSSPAINHPHIPFKSHRFLPFLANSSPSTSPCLQFHHHFPGRKVEFARNTRIALTRIVCSVATTGEIIESSETVKQRSVSVVLLAGGKGKRMGGSMPKQYLPLLGQPIALYSFYTFSRMVQVKEIIVVCDPSYREIFKEIFCGVKQACSEEIFCGVEQACRDACQMKLLDASEQIRVDIKFALPGKERQDSVFNGFQEIDGSSELVCIHDSARPLVTPVQVEQVLKDAWLNGAAVLGVPVKATIKEANNESYVVKTLNRKSLWEMQTPQVIKPELLRNGFELVYGLGLEVTDDVSIVEHLKHPVFITEGSYTNIKVTTPDDLLLAERILSIDANCRIAVCAQ